jgi:hypothetical protein
MGRTGLTKSSVGAKAVAPPYSTCCHTFRATGITTYLENGGTLQHAQTIANHVDETY